MNKLILALAFLSSSVFATQPLSDTHKGEIELLLAEAASKLIYLNNDCSKPVDPEKFKELAKIKAFSEGYMTIEGISWENTKRKANKMYGGLKIEAPLGEFCSEFREDIRGHYRFLKDTNS
ncbi:MAG: hypothetical protein MJK12_17405 [Colwellia sp.]|nr:hypothetical protein [Colwellia sp.]